MLYFSHPFRMRTSFLEKKSLIFSSAHIKSNICSSNLEVIRKNVSFESAQTNVCPKGQKWTIFTGTSEGIGGLSTESRSYHSNSIQIMQLDL